MIRIVYIAGVGFSGSTLLSMLLDAHPAIACVGELTGPLRIGAGDDYPCSCGSPITACSFWGSVGRRMETRGQPFDPRDWAVRFDMGRQAWVRQILTRSLRSNALDDLRDRLVLAIPSWREQLSRLLDRNAALVECVLEETGKGVLADASKHPIRACYLSRIPGVDLRIVHLVRDAPGMIYSRMRNQGLSLDSGIRFWNRGAAHVTRLLARFPEDRCLRIRYEDLCADPAGELRRVTDLLDLPAHPAGARLGEGVHHVIGNRMRMQSRPVIERDDRWQNGLGAEEIRRVLAGTGRYRRRFGYS